MKLYTQPKQGQGTQEMHASHNVLQINKHVAMLLPTLNRQGHVTSVAVASRIITIL